MPLLTAFIESFKEVHHQSFNRGRLLVAICNDHVPDIPPLCIKYPLVQCSFSSERLDAVGPSHTRPSSPPVAFHHTQHAVLFQIVIITPGHVAEIA